ncbi:MAG: hypothetical protein ABJL72_21675, partial [Roseobacter sp.]
MANYHHSWACRQLSPRYRSPEKITEELFKAAVCYQLADGSFVPLTSHLTFNSNGSFAQSDFTSVND